MKIKTECSKLLEIKIIKLKFYYFFVQIFIKLSDINYIPTHFKELNFTFSEISANILFINK